MKVLAIAINTFREAVRNRVLYVLLFFAILIMFGAWIAATLSIDEQTKIVRDLGVGAINFIAVLIAVFVGVGLVYNDLDKKTIYTIVSKPIDRWQFLLGKYLGLLLTISVNILFMTWIFASVLHFRDMVSTDRLNAALWTMTENGATNYKGTIPHLLYYLTSGAKALVFGLGHILTLGYDSHWFPYTSGLFASSVLTILEMAVITAFAVLFSSFSSPTLSAFMTVIIFIIGRLNQDLYLFADEMVRRSGGLEQLSTGQVMAYYFGTGAAYVCPNLSVFNQRAEIANRAAVHLTGLDVAYAVVYTVMVLFVAMMIFNRRNFK